MFWVKPSLWTNLQPFMYVLRWWLDILICMSCLGTLCLHLHCQRKQYFLENEPVVMWNHLPSVSSCPLPFILQVMFWVLEYCICAPANLSVLCFRRAFHFGVPAAVSGWVGLTESCVLQFLRKPPYFCTHVNPRILTDRGWYLCCCPGEKGFKFVPCKYTYGLYLASDFM